VLGFVAPGEPLVAVAGTVRVFLAEAPRRPESSGTGTSTATTLPIVNGLFRLKTS